MEAPDARTTQPVSILRPAFRACRLASAIFFSACIAGCTPAGGSSSDAGPLTDGGSSGNGQTPDGGYKLLDAGPAGLSLLDQCGTGSLQDQDGGDILVQETCAFGGISAGTLCPVLGASGTRFTYCGEFTNGGDVTCGNASPVIACFNDALAMCEPAVVSVVTHFVDATNFVYTFVEPASDGGCQFHRITLNSWNYSWTYSTNCDTGPSQTICTDAAVEACAFTNDYPTDGDDRLICPGE